VAGAGGCHKLLYDKKTSVLFLFPIHVLLDLNVFGLGLPGVRTTRTVCYGPAAAMKQTYTVQLI
jgi:hypothetical protein